MPSNPTDAELMSRFERDGDVEALHQLVGRYDSLVLGICRRILTCDASVDDAFQATFLLLMERGHTVRGDVFGPWLYRVAYRAALNVRGRRDVMSLDALPSECFAATELDAFRHIEMRETQLALEEEMDALPERLRMPLVMFHLQGRSRNEIAEELGTTLGAVKSRLERARARLRQRLVRRGISVAAGMAAFALAKPYCAAAPAPLVETTTLTILAYRRGEPLDPVMDRFVVSLKRQIGVSMMHSQSIRCCVVAASVAIVLLAAAQFRGPSAQADGPFGQGQGGALQLTQAATAVPAQPPIAQATFSAAQTQPAPLAADDSSVSAASQHDRGGIQGSFNKKVGGAEIDLQFDSRALHIDIQFGQGVYSIDAEYSKGSSGDTIYGILHACELTNVVAAGELDDAAEINAQLAQFIDQPFSIRYHAAGQRLILKDIKLGGIAPDAEEFHAIALLLGSYNAM